MHSEGGQFDIAIAGAGIAGLTAAVTAARLGRKTLVLTGEAIGGNLLSIERVEGYPGFPEGVAGYELCPLAQAQAAEAGAEFAGTPVEAIEGDAPELRLLTAEGEFRARSLIVATGSSIKALGVPGEDRLKGKGVSHCASCDGPMLRGAKVVVVGGGDSALQEALTLVSHVSGVVLLHRGEALSAQAAYRGRVLGEPRIEIRYRTEVEEILGSEVVTGVRTSAGVVEASAVFVYIGLAPNIAFLNGRLPLDERGSIKTDGSFGTRAAGIFAAGSVRAGWPGRAAGSAGEGAAAAVAAHRYLERLEQ
jgi:thioredoxin reductase (NADPH)